MIYQILFVFALLIVALNNASDSANGIPDFITKFHFQKAKNENFATWSRMEMFNQTFEWDPNKPGWTQILPRGFYGVYKESGDAWELFKEFVIEHEDGKAVALPKFDDFKLDATYVIWGVTHEQMKFNPDHTPRNKDYLLGNGLAKLGRSSKQCFKDRLKPAKRSGAAMDEEHSETSASSIKNRMIISVLIPVAVLLVF